METKGGIGIRTYPKVAGSRRLKTLPVWPIAFLLAFIATVVLLFVPGCTKKQEDKRAPLAEDPTHRWYFGHTLYETNLRSMSDEGTFEGLIGRLDDLHAFGIRNLLLMPIHPTGEEGRVGTLGNLYAPRNHMAVDEAYGGEAGFRKLLDEAHARGMYVLLDLVPHHGSLDHVMTLRYPEWFLRDETGTFRSKQPMWKDITDFDFEQDGARRYIADMTMHWATQFDIDGIRMAQAGMVPDEVWRELLAELNQKRPDLFVLAESEHDKMIELGFDATYNSALRKASIEGVHDDFVEPAPLEDMWNAASWPYENYPHGAQMVNFIEDHYARRSVDKVLYGYERVKPFAAFLFLLPGIPQLLNGQEIGVVQFETLVDATPIDWENPHKGLQGFYHDLIELRHSSTALLRGNLARVPYDSKEILVFMRQTRGETLLCMINFSDFQPEIPLPDSLQGEIWHHWHEGDFLPGPVSLHNRKIGEREIVVARRGAQH